jgi:hypothetical protein
VTNIVSDSDSGLLHKGCSHEPFLGGVVILGADPKTSAKVLVEEAGVVAVGAEVSVASDVDPQAITASMVTRQKAIRTLLTITFIYCNTENFWMRLLPVSAT